MDEVASATKEILGIIGMLNNKDGSTIKDINNVLNLLHGRTDPDLIQHIVSYAVSEGVLQCKNRRYKVRKQMNVHENLEGSFERNYDSADDSKEEPTYGTYECSSKEIESRSRSELVSTPSNESFVSNEHSVVSDLKGRKRKSKRHITVKYPFPKKVPRVETEDSFPQPETVEGSADSFPQSETIVGSTDMEVCEESGITSSGNIVDEISDIEQINDRLKEASMQEIFSRENVDRNKIKTLQEDYQLNNEMKNVMKRICKSDEPDERESKTPDACAKEGKEGQTAFRSITGAVTSVVKRIFNRNQANDCISDECEDGGSEMYEEHKTSEDGRHCVDAKINKVMKNILCKEDFETKENNENMPMSEVIKKVMERTTASTCNDASNVKVDNVSSTEVKKTVERMTKSLNTEAQDMKNDDQTIHEIMAKIIKKTPKAESPCSDPPDTKGNYRSVNEIMNKVIDRMKPLCNDAAVSDQISEDKATRNPKTDRQISHPKHSNSNKENVTNPVVGHKYSTRSKVKSVEKRERSKTLNRSDSRPNMKTKDSSSDEDNYDYMCSSTHSVGKQFPPYI